MSKRSQDSQGGFERYGGYGEESSGNMADKPTQATAAQMARRKIASARKPSGSQRSSRAGTPTANPFGGQQPQQQQQQQQSMPSFGPPGQSGTGFGGGFNFTAGAPANPFANAQQNGTPPPAAFQFGGNTNQTPAQQNGGSSMFGNTGSGFGSTFGSNNSQPQQNGFNPSTSSLFSNQNATANNNTSSFGGFGQNNQSQSQQNGLTQSSNASFPSFGKENENPFKSFGQPQQQTQSTPSTSFGGFGQDSQQQNGEKTPAKPSFGGFGQSTPPESQQSQQNGSTSMFGNTETPKANTSNIFAGFGQQQNGTTTSFGSTSQAAETPKPNNGSVLGVQQQNDAPKGLFGSTPTPPPDQTPKGGDGVFLGLNADRASTIKQGMFTQNRSESPKPPSSNLFNFGQQNDATAQSQETPKQSNQFGGMNQSQQTNGAKSNMFGGDTTSEQQTPKPSSSLFSGQQNNNSSAFKFGQSQQEDSSMTTPGRTPQKNNMFGSAAAASNETPAGQGRSLFDRVERNETGATAETPSFTPSTSFFNAQSTTAEKQTPAPQGRSMFDRVEQPSTAQKETSFTPSTNLLNKSGEKASETPSAAPWLSHAPAPAAPTVTPPTPNTARKMTATGTMNEGLTQSEKDTFKALNEGLLKHMAMEDPNADWSTIMQYYLQKAAEIRQKPQPKFDAPTTSSSNASASQQPSASASRPTASTTSNMFGSATPKAPASSGSNMFGAAGSQQTPKSNTSQQLPPATAPVNQKRSALSMEDSADDTAKGPATEKRARPNEPINYPKLPENASETSKLFQSALDKPSSASTGFKPPSAPSGMPTFSAPSAGSGGFLASFGKKANAEEEKEKRKRKDEDYDSDEETEEQWEKRDKEEQEAKRKKIAEAAKSGTGFVLAGSGAPATPMGAGKSLFDRVSKDASATAPSKPGMFSSQTPAAEKPTTNMFGSKTPSVSSTSNIFGGLSRPTSSAAGDDSGQDKEQTPVDKTWKPNTPVKFGSSTATESTTPAAPPPAFGSLFGSNTSKTGTDSLNVPGAKPTIGFNFGAQPSSSLNTSRATTPGITTDGEGASTAGDEDEDGQNDPQGEDKAVLLPSEHKGEDLVLEVNAKASQMGPKKDAATGEVSKGWVDKGTGPFWVLQNSDTGRVRVLQKIKSGGRTIMNYLAYKDGNYACTGKNGNLISGAFAIDGRVEHWMIQVKAKADAEKIVRLLKEGV